MVGLRLIKPYPGMVIKESVKFIPGVYTFNGENGIIIDANDITVDGNGAVIKQVMIKAGQPIVRLNIGYDSLSTDYVENDNSGFYGIGIKSEGHDSVSIKNLQVHGFDIGIYIKKGTKWTIEDNDFSDNFSDIDWGWDDHGFHGAILFENVNESIIKSNKATNVWDAINLRYSNRNTVIENDFSHVSDVCLKLWNSCENKVIDNNLSYGIRIKSGETHARDSSGVLIESGSDYNIFKKNDITHCGDGIFIRVLNSWMSCGNYFEENDCSYANNNAIEAWAQGNSYVRNKANYSSYGFWLGGSDNTLVLENEVAYNGTVFHNAPESFGNAGIAVVNGSGSHIRMIGNYIHDNYGPGVAIRYNCDYPSYHWVIQKNKIERNRTINNFKGHGIYLKNAQWIDIAGNELEDNEGEPIFFDGNTSDIFIREAKIEDIIPSAAFTISSRSIEVGDEVIFKAIESKTSQKTIEHRWDLGDRTIASGRIVKHEYKTPGFYRMGLTVNDGKMADLAYHNIYVNNKGKEIGTEDFATNWTYSGDDVIAVPVEDRENFISGDHSIRLSTGKGICHRLIYPKDQKSEMRLNNKDKITFYIKFQSDSEIDLNRTNKKPIIKLHTSETDYFEYKPVESHHKQIFTEICEEKYEWKYLEIPLRPLDGWECSLCGEPVFDCINYIEIEEETYKDSVSNFWIDGLKFVSDEHKI